MRSAAFIALFLVCGSAAAREAKEFLLAIRETFDGLEFHSAADLATDGPAATGRRCWSNSFPFRSKDFDLVSNGQVTKRLVLL
jgi:hypothetical protein